MHEKIVPLLLLHDGNLPLHDGNMPLHGGNMPSHGGNLPSHGGNMPSHGGNMPSHGGNMPSHGGNMPSHGGNMSLHGGSTSQSTIFQSRDSSGTTLPLRMSPLKKRPYHAHNDVVNDSTRDSRMSPFKKRPCRLVFEEQDSQYFVDSTFKTNDNVTNPTSHFGVITNVGDRASLPSPPSSYQSKKNGTSDLSDTDSDKSSCDEALIDVVNDCVESDTSNKTDSSMSTQSSNSTSPSSDSLSGTSPDSNSSLSETKKKVRTNYAPAQVQALERVFHENPYPDSDMMEKLSKDLNIPEGKIKVWFQNKRARWRRRIQDNSRGFSSPFLSPVMSPVASPYGFLPGNPMYGPPGSPMFGASSPMLPGPSPLLPGQFIHGFQKPVTPPSSPTNIGQTPTTQPAQMTSHFQPPMPSYFYRYPYGMVPTPYYCG